VRAVGSPFFATTSPFDPARRQHAPLPVSIQTIEHALARPAAEPDWWHGMGECLTALREAFADHVAVTEGADGLYAELLDHAPRLASGLHVLAQEHAELGRAIDEVRQRIPAATPDDLRGQAGELLRGLSRHRQRGADLVYEAYQTDIGGET
jgi:hypothetical protein